MTLPRKPLTRLGFALFLLPFFYAGAETAGSPGDAVASLSGIVTDTTGAVLSGAVVTLTDTVTGVRRGITQAGRDGEFSFPQLGRGDYRVVIEASGFGSGTQRVFFRGTPIQLKVVLAAAPVETEVIVHAADSSPAEPGRIPIDQRQIERMPSESVSSPLSSLIMAATPGVAADSNGSFHPLGEHAEASFVIDGQPITDQQSRMFSTQISLNALQSLEVHQGAPRIDAGDKPGMVVIAETKSGLGLLKPHGGLTLSRGSFAASSLSASLGFGSDSFGSFTAIDALNSGRFLDTPEVIPLHANGNAENVIERLDAKATEKTSLQLNLSLSRSWFQTPNTYDQESTGQNQRQTVASFNIAPQMLHTLNRHAFNQTNLWVRQDQIRYRPSDDMYSDTPAYLQQTRRLTNAGLHDEWMYSRGRHNVIAGIEFKHTFLSEQFATGLTSPSFNSPCLNADGSPSPDTSFTDPSQCQADGLAVNSAFLPGLVGIDLTRGGSLFGFQKSADIQQVALFTKDSIRFDGFTTDLGLRFDKYNGLAHSHGFQPRVGVVYFLKPIGTNFHLSYSRIFITPYNENLILASSSGPGSISSSLGAAESAVLDTGRRNQFNVGFEKSMDRFTLSSEYLWKFTYGAYDFDVLLNSPLTFPTQFRKSKIDGALVRLTLKATHGVNGFLTVSHVRSRLFGPEIGGIGFTAPYGNVVRPDHDEDLAMNLNLRYQSGKHGPWISGVYRYDGGLVSVATPNLATVLQLTGDEQQQMGLHCGSTFATVSSPLRSCSRPVSATRIRIPAPGTENDDLNPSRIAVRSTVNLSAGGDNLIHRENQSLGIRVSIINLNNTKALYNFLSTFSGTHFLTSRAVTVGIRYAF